MFLSLDHSTRSKKSSSVEEYRSTELIALATNDKKKQEFSN